ncbi:hypothetical protein [Caballeronia sp. LZ032]|nr:hypothetical protein [Caballeronia sp. LZ032]MDR5879026.1 hypothetical protein [Caballeronia sp. LZ032]
MIDLVHAKDYTAAHELTGAQDAIQAIFELADRIDDDQRIADEQAQAAS